MIIIPIGLFILQFSKAQDTTNYLSKKNEINIGYFNLFQLNSINNLGIGYKHAFGNSALRLGTSLSYNYSDNSSGNDSIKQTSKKISTTIIPRIGYEFRQNYGRIFVYYGIDVSYSIQKEINNNYYGTNSKNEYITHGLGLNPLIGIKYFFNKNFSISTETSLNFMYSSQKLKSSNYYDNNEETLNKNKNIYVNLSPLGIFSLNYHF